MPDILLIIAIGVAALVVFGLFLIVKDRRSRRDSRARNTQPRQPRGRIQR